MRTHRMFWSHVLALLAASLAQPACRGEGSPFELLDEPLSPQIALQCFREAQEVWAADGGKLWGVSLSRPILFVDRQTRAVIASQADSEGLLTREGEVYVGTLPAEETIAGTAQHWAGVTWAMLPWPLPKEKSERLNMLMHESFHCVQPKLGLSIPTAANSHLDGREGRIWLQLEWRALQAALQTPADKRRQAVTDALTFRAYRRSLFPDAVEEERAMEAVEGTAEYTGIRLSSGSESAALARALKDFELAKNFPTYTYSFAYVTGVAYGLLLDSASPDWRKGFDASKDLGECLREALSVSLPADFEAAAKARGEQYDMRQLVAIEEERANSAEGRLARYRQRFVTGPVLVIPIHSMQFRFDPRDIHALDDLGKVYPKMKMSDAWGILEVAGGALIAGDWSKVVVPAPSDINARPLTGDGWTLELKDSFELRAGKRKGDFVVQRADDEP